MKRLRRLMKRGVTLASAALLLGFLPGPGIAASLEEIVQAVEREKSAGNVEPEAYDDVMAPLNGAKAAQSEGDAESYRSYLEAARLVVTAAVGDTIKEEAAGKLLLLME
ncbi:MAG TPA: hypothetical protein VJR29_09925 [bacterium]|nr:hypothetical protein [bacterium]